MTDIAINTESRRDFMRQMAAASLGVGLLGRSFAADVEKPNIVLILADDLGVGDLSCYGASLIETPNIDRIAKEGVQFTDAHAPAAICTPTRYGLLTGRYFWRRKQPWDRNFLLIDEGQTTIASFLKRQGYDTACVGKWHLGFGLEGPIDWNKPLKPGPLEVGFDYYFGTPMSHNEPPQVYVENHHVVGLDPNDPVSITEPGDGAYWGIIKGGEKAQFDPHLLGTTHARKVVDLIEQQDETPFFLYFATNNVHGPLTPHQRFQGNSQFGVYGDFILELDWMVGEVLAALERKGMLENTLVLFSSDNGAMLRREAEKAGHHSSGEWLGQKTDVWEGGHRVPTMARWPGKIKAGRTSDALICLTDVMATLFDLFNVPMGQDDGPDSVSFLHALLDTAPKGPVRTQMVMQGVGDMGVRDGDWLYVRGQGSGGYTTKENRKGWMHLREMDRTNSNYTADGMLKDDAPPAQLYNLAKDPQETTNLYNTDPERAKRMDEMFSKSWREGRSR